MDFNTRMKKAFTVLFDTSFGTLWWASNDLWNQEESFVLKAEQEGNKHPGVSIQAEAASDPYIVPLLLGRSKKCSGNAAVELEMGSGKPGYFGTLKPVWMSCLNFLDGSINVNRIKPVLTAAEKEKLRQFIQRRLSWSMK